MSPLASTRALHVTLLSVCVDEAVIQAALRCTEDRDWTVIQAAFDGYISSKRRPHLPDILRAGDGCIALINFEADPEQAAAAASYLHQAFTGRIVVVAISQESNPSSLLLAMHAGCMEFLAAPTEHAFQECFSRVEQHFAERTTTVTTTGSTLALLGAKGGVGTTTLGVHLATYLVQNNNKKVLLIDSKAQFGHTCIYLGMDGSNCHFQEVVGNVNRLDSDLLRALVATHVSGLHVLSSPDVGQVARPMHPEDVTATLDFLRSEYDFVLVDCADTTDEITRAVIAASSQVYVVATPEITAIRDLSRYVDDLSHMDDSSKVRVVINRYSSQFAVSLEEIEKAIRLPVTFNIPNNYIELVRSANLGVPVSADGKSGFTAELTKWAHSLVGTVASEPTVEQVKPSFARIWPALKRLLSNAASFSAVPAGKRA